MTDDIFSELRELQRHASGLRSLIAAAEASAPPQAEGADATGTVRATIGADGLPAAIRVQDHWQRRLSGEQFGAAVVEAFSAAVEQRMAAWTDALQDSGWPSKVDEIRAELDGPPHTATMPVKATPVTPAPGADRPRPLDEMLDDMVGAFDNVDALSASPAASAEGSGTSGYGKFAIRLSRAGLVSCVVDGQWASQQSADAITEAFDEALARAKADLAAKAEAPDPARNLDRVLGEALALLNDPQRLAES